ARLATGPPKILRSAPTSTGTNGASDPLLHGGRGRARALAPPRAAGARAVAGAHRAIRAGGGRLAGRRSRAGRLLSGGGRRDRQPDQEGPAARPLSHRRGGLSGHLLLPLSPRRGRRASQRLLLGGDGSAR